MPRRQLSRYKLRSSVDPLCTCLRYSYAVLFGSGPFDYEDGSAVWFKTANRVQCNKQK